MKEPNVLLVDLAKSENFSSVLRETLRSSPILRIHVLKNSFEVSRAGDVETYLTRLVSFFDPDLIILVLPAGRLKKINYRFLEPTRFGYTPPVSIDTSPPIGILMILKADAPLELLEAASGEGILSVMWSAIGHYPPAAVKPSVRQDVKPTPLIGRNLLFLRQLSKIPRAAECNSGVLIEGEPGTGRNTFARTIHMVGDRAGRPFVRVDCRVIPPDLIEKQLFGREKEEGQRKDPFSPGLIERAEGGTLFLEEVDKLPASVQIRLLRLLRERTFRPHGGTSERPADVRLIGALTNSARDSLRNSRLRRDFYYGLSVISIQLPALRERREDILPLAMHFLNDCFAKSGSRALHFSEEVLCRLAFYDWPGNVMELKHSVERAASRSKTPIIRESDILLPRKDYPPVSLREAKQRFMTRFMSMRTKNLSLC
jgi:hypothetical protein